MANLNVCDVVFTKDTKSGSEKKTAKITDDNGQQGILVCSQHTKRIGPDTQLWCDCLQRMMDEALDAPQIGAINDEQVVTIPVVPSKDAWAKVVLTDLHRATMHSIELLLYQPDENAEPPREHIGITAQGDGRGAIRLMLWDWLRWRFADVAACPSPVHKSPHFAPSDKRDREPSVQDVVTTLSIMTKGFCDDCLVFHDASADVPELP